MTEINIEVSDLIQSLNSQISSLNLDLHIARLQISTLENKIRELEGDLTVPPAKPGMGD